MLREEPPIRIAVVGGGFGGIYAFEGARQTACKPEPSV
jgi:NADH dehydrogenase FAD-containing subunit